MMDESTPLFAIAVAAELAGMHPQTLRQYDRLGLVVPSRTVGRGRRYSARDVERLRTIQHLSQDEGINLAGIRRILHLEDQVRLLRGRVEMLATALDPGHRIFTADASGDIVAVPRGKHVPQERGGTLVVWRPRR